MKIITKEVYDNQKMFKIYVTSKYGLRLISQAVLNDNTEIRKELTSKLYESIECSKDEKLEGECLEEFIMGKHASFTLYNPEGDMVGRIKALIKKEALFELLDQFRVNVCNLEDSFNEKD